VIGLTKLKPDFRIKYQAPYYLVHRAHFHSALHKLALHHGVKVIVDSKVIEYDEHAPSVTVQAGERYTADLVVAADGESTVSTRFQITTLTLSKGSSPLRGA
jgi:salicylate hydroxylase